VSIITPPSVVISEHGGLRHLSPLLWSSKLSYQFQQTPNAKKTLRDKTFTIDWLTIDSLHWTHPVKNRWAYELSMPQAHLHSLSSSKNKHSSYTCKISNNNVVLKQGSHRLAFDQLKNLKS